jgi:hypothetical protein
MVGRRPTSFVSVGLRSGRAPRHGGSAIFPQPLNAIIRSELPPEPARSYRRAFSTSSRIGRRTSNGGGASEFIRARSSEIFTLKGRSASAKSLKRLMVEYLGQQLRGHYREVCCRATGAAMTVHTDLCRSSVGKSMNCRRERLQHGSRFPLSYGLYLDLSSSP